MDIRFALFFSGQWDTLVSDIALSSVQTCLRDGLKIPQIQVIGQDIFQEQQIKRASKLVKEGLISRACRALESSSPAPAPQDTLNKLIRLHPSPS